MTPPGNGVPPALMGHLSDALRALETVRRGTGDGEEERREALEDLERLGEVLDATDPGEVPGELATHLDDARVALEEKDLEGARESLLEMGRSIDRFLRD